MSSSSAHASTVVQPALVAWQRAIAGCGAYCAATIVSSPLDVVKVRAQAEEGSKKKPSWQLAYDMVRHEGLAVLFAGLAPALMMAPAAMVQYTLIDPLRARLPLIVAALIAGWLDITIKCPFDRIKTQMQGSDSEDGRGVREMLHATLRTSGVRGLWAGYAATLARDLPYLILKWYAEDWPHPPADDARCATAASMPFSYTHTLFCPDAARCVPVDRSVRRVVYVQVQSLFVRGPLVSFASEARNLIAGAVAGGVAATAVTPADVIKTRLQVARGGHEETEAAAPRGGSFAIARTVLAESGVGGFFRGIGPRLARIPFYTAVTLATFELIKDGFLAHAGALG